MVNGRARTAGLEAPCRLAAAPGGSRRSAFRLRSRSSSGADADPARGRVPRAPLGGTAAGGDGGPVDPGAPAGSSAASPPAPPPATDVVRRRAALSLGWKGGGSRPQPLCPPPGGRPAHSPPRRHVAAAASYPGAHGLPAPLRRRLQYSESAAISTPRMEGHGHRSGSPGLLAPARGGPPARSTPRADGLVRLESAGDAGGGGHGSCRRSRRGGGGGGRALPSVPAQAAGRGGSLGGGRSTRKIGAARGVPPVGTAGRAALAVPRHGRRAGGAGDGPGGGGRTRRPPGAGHLRRLLGVRRPRLRAALAPAGPGRRRARPRPRARPRQGVDGGLQDRQPPLSLSLPPAPRQAPPGRRHGRGGARLPALARSGGGHGAPLRRAAPPVRHGLSLVSPLGAPLGRPAPPHRLAGPLGADPPFLHSTIRRSAAVALGVPGDLGAVFPP